jgi:hypothetical protein
VESALKFVLNRVQYTVDTGLYTINNVPEHFNEACTQWGLRV